MKARSIFPQVANTRLGYTVLVTSIPVSPHPCRREIRSRAPYRHVIHPQPQETDVISTVHRPHCKSTPLNPSLPTMSDDPLFSPTLISPSVAAELPENYTVRPLRRSDYHQGFLDVLRVLTTVGDISEDKWNERYDWMSKRNDEYFLLCILDGSGEKTGEGRIVGTGAVIVERKLCVFPVVHLV